MTKKEAYRYLEKGKKVYFISTYQEKIYLEMRPDGFLYWTGETFKVYELKEDIGTKEEQKKYWLENASPNGWYVDSIDLETKYIRFELEDD